MYKKGKKGERWRREMKLEDRMAEYIVSFMITILLLGAALGLYVKNRLDVIDKNVKEVKYNIKSNVKYNLKEWVELEDAE